MSALSPSALQYARALVRIGGLDSAAQILGVPADRLAVFLASLDEPS